MDPIIGGALISGGAALLGGLMGQDAQESANDNNTKINNRNNDLQREFAQNGIRWRVDDAKAAGIHPLYALGANTPTFSPSSVPFGVEDSMAASVSNMGQDISRAVSSTKTQEEREVAALQIASLNMDIEGKALDNQLRAAQLNKMTTVGPPLPTGSDDAANFIPGQNSSGLVKIKPAERTASQPGRLAQEAGWRPDVSYSRTDTGLVPMVPNSLSESLEDDVVGKLMWRIRNQLMPNLTGEGAPAASQLPKGFDAWKWSHSRQEWFPINTKQYNYEKSQRQQNYDREWSDAVNKARSRGHF